MAQKDAPPTQDLEASRPVELLDTRPQARACGHRRSSPQPLSPGRRAAGSSLGHTLPEIAVWGVGQPTCDPLDGRTPAQGCFSQEEQRGVSYG